MSPAAVRRAAGPAHDEGALPLVLLHAFPLDSRMWDAAGALVPGPRPVYAVDLPGSPGHTDALPAVPSLDACADLVAAALGEAGIVRAVVAGLSMGGYVALALLERHPTLVAGLSLVDTKSVADTPAAAASRLARAGRLEESGTVDEVLPDVDTLLGETSRAARRDVRDEVLGWIREQAPAGLAWSQRAMAARPDRTAVLHAFPGPVTVVVGDEDTVTPVAAAEHMSLAAGGAPLVVVRGAGHLSAVEDPAAVAAALADLAQRTDAS
ncbi:MAG TPA: alpha/beta hydrolase [Cellulomonas sp.]